MTASKIKSEDDHVMTGLRGQWKAARRGVFADYFKDKNGNVVLWQSPNPPLLIWIVLRVIALVLQDGTLRSGVNSTATIAISIWAYLELTSGVTIFRRLIGTTILGFVIFNLFV